mmetsp:Transcript_19741/g.40190  ORF Transcript_19741/g.40190 Transcript_19741/m.40190 type:complete len:206 (+) Transcript_19741:537-1154(+)
MQGHQGLRRQRRTLHCGAGAETPSSVHLRRGARRCLMTGSHHGHQSRRPGQQQRLLPRPLLRIASAGAVPTRRWMARSVPRWRGTAQRHSRRQERRSFRWRPQRHNSRGTRSAAQQAPRRNLQSRNARRCSRSQRPRQRHQSHRSEMGRGRGTPRACCRRHHEGPERLPPGVSHSPHPHGLRWPEPAPESASPCRGTPARGQGAA